MVNVSVEVGGKVPSVEDFKPRDLYLVVDELARKGLYAGIVTSNDIRESLGLKPAAENKIILEMTDEHYKWLTEQDEDTDDDEFITSDCWYFIKNYIINNYPMCYTVVGISREDLKLPWDEDTDGDDPEDHTGNNGPLLKFNISEETKKILEGLRMPCTNFHDYSRNNVPFFKPLKPVLPIAKRMWSMPGGYTTVEWTDGTKTTVKAENEEKASEYGGFCAAFVKKCLGSTTAAMKQMEEAQYAIGEKKREREHMKQCKKELNEIRARRNAHNREMRINDWIEAEKIRQEAERRMKKEEEKNNGDR